MLLIKNLVRQLNKEKTMKFKKIGIVFALATLFSSPVMAITPGGSGGVGGQQRWPVTNETSESYLRQILEAQSSTAKQGVQNAQTLAELQAKNVSIQNADNREALISVEKRKVIQAAAPTLEKCIAVSQGIGFGRAVGFQGQVDNVSQKTVTKAVGNPQGSNYTNITDKKEELGLCTADDVVNGVGKCQKVGKYASLNNNVNISRKSPDGSGSIDNEQYDAAIHQIQSKVYGHAPDTSKMAGSVDEVRESSIWYSRVSIFASVETRVAAWHKKIMVSQAPGTGLYNLWNSPEMVSTYRSFHDQHWNPDPSMAEIIETLVAKDYFNNPKLYTTKSEIEVLRMQAKQQALTNYLLQKQLIAAEDNGLLLSAIGQQLYSKVDNQNSSLGKTGQ
jgi:hypothetical protein